MGNTAKLRMVSLDQDATIRRVTGLGEGAVELLAQPPICVSCPDMNLSREKIAAVLTRRIERLNQEFAQIRQRGGDTAPSKRRARVLWEAWRLVSYS